MHLKSIVIVVLTSCLFFTGCSKSNPTPSTSNNNNTPAPLSIASPANFNATIGGTGIAFTEGTNAMEAIYSNNALGGFNSANGNFYNLAKESGLVYKGSNGNGYPKFSITIGAIPTFPSYPMENSNPTFKALFSVKSYPYDATLINGIKTTYTDANGKLWSSALGTADQTGSTFVVTKVVDGTDPITAVYEVAIQASFNCTLYDGLGGSLVLTNGTFSGKFTNQ